MKSKIQALPKISLHDHLDGGLRPQTIIELSEAIAHSLPANNAKDLGDWFYKAADSGSLERYLETFEHTTAVMQTKEGLTRVAREFVLDLHDDGVIYGEIRWAPEQHLRSGLSLDETVEAVQDGLEQGMEEVEAAGGFIRTGQLLTAMRHANQALEIAELAIRHRNNGVVGFDIAGAEKGFLPSRHKVAFDYLAEQLFPCTVHAGEGDGIESIKDAIVSGRALRLGHGVRLIEDVMFSRSEGDTDLVVLGEVAEWVHDRGIALELAPSSNLQTGAVKMLGESMEDHPFDILYELGFKVTVNTDNRLMSRTTLTRELELLMTTFNYSLADIEQFQMNAAEASFQALDEREELMDMISDGFAKG
ncbi:MAG: adenosine deaminase [Actinomycetota bacterium]